MDQFVTEPEENLKEVLADNPYLTWELLDDFINSVKGCYYRMSLWERLRGENGNKALAQKYLEKSAGIGLLVHELANVKEPSLKNKVVELRNEYQKVSQFEKRDYAKDSKVFIETVESNELSDLQKANILDGQLHESIYQDIKREYLEKGNGYPKPKERLVYYLAGQPGSGKTELREKLLAPFPLYSPVVINTDSLRDFHPKYKYYEGHPELFKYAPYIVDVDSSKWAGRLLRESMAEGRTVIIDSTMGGNADTFIKGMETFKSEGYKVEIHIYAVPLEISYLGAVMRYHKQVANKGFGRFVRKEVQDKNYVILPENLEKVINGAGVKNISIYERSVKKGDLLSAFRVKPELAYHTSQGDVKEVLESLAKFREFSVTSIKKEYYSKLIGQAREMVLGHGGDVRELENNLSRLISEIQVTEKMANKEMVFKGY